MILDSFAPVSWLSLVTHLPGHAHGVNTFRGSEFSSG